MKESKNDGMRGGQAYCASIKNKVVCFACRLMGVEQQTAQLLPC